MTISTALHNMAKSLQLGAKLVTSV